MIIREANNSDAQAIRDLVFGALTSYGLSPDPANTDEDLEDIEAHYHLRGGWFAVLEEDGVIVGCYGLHRIDDSECELRKMYLRAAFRGRGFGKRLLEHALEKAEALGFAVLCLETASVLKEAIALYEKYGFAPYDTAPLSARCDRAYRKNMHKPGQSLSSRFQP